MKKSAQKIKKGENFISTDSHKSFLSQGIVFQYNKTKTSVNMGISSPEDV